MMQSTSLKAYYESVLPTLGARHHAVLVKFMEGKKFTNEQLGNELDWPINEVTPRVKELRDMGYLIQVGTAISERTKREAMVWSWNEKLTIKEY